MTNRQLLNDKLTRLQTELSRDFSEIPPERKAKSERLAAYLSQKFAAGKTPALTVICTHNSRRSHLGQILAAFAADTYGLPKIRTFSGGTEATAFNPRAVKALRTLGFEITSANENDTNPFYEVSWRADLQPLTAFSKKYDSAPNPTENFAAIMVCTEADAGCPFVPGCDFRLSLPYLDPKAADDTKEEAFTYLAKVTEIGRGMFYVMSRVEVN